MLTCLVLASCSVSHNTPQHMVLRWENYSKGTGDPGYAEWYFDHEYMGKGRSAFHIILERLQECPPGSTLFLENEPFLATPSSPIFLHPPYYEVLNTLVDILLEKQVTVTRQGYIVESQGILSEREVLETLLWGVVEQEYSLESLPKKGYTPFLERYWSVESQ